MALDGADRARLDRIENELVAADPALADSFRHWRPRTAPASWSVAAPWMLFVFVLGFVTWVLAPALGVALALVGGAAWVGSRLRRSRSAIGRPPRR